MSLLGDILKFGVKEVTSDSSTFNQEYVDAMGDVRSIAARAKKSIFTYPVIFTNSISDINVASKIAKFVEYECAVFTQLTIGSTSKVGGPDLGEYLKKYGGESAMNLWNAFLDENPDYLYSKESDSKSFEDDPGSKGGGGSNSAKIIEMKLSKAVPTMIEAEFILPGQGTSDKIKVPIAIKAIPHFITTEELVMLCDSAADGISKLTRFVKWTTGEISFFKDFMLEMDIAARDSELYKKFGKHPWYQQFQDRKAKNKAKGTALGMSAFLDIGNIVGRAAKSVGGTLPMASIICTRTEMEKSSKMRYDFMKRESRYIKQMMQTLHILGLGIYDPDLEVVTFYFNGLDSPMIVSIKDMGSGDSDANKVMAETLKLMAQRGI